MNRNREKKHKNKNNPQTSRAYYRVRDRNPDRQLTV